MQLIIYRYDDKLTLILIVLLYMLISYYITIFGYKIRKNSKISILYFNFQILNEMMLDSRSKLQKRNSQISPALVSDSDAMKL